MTNRIRQIAALGQAVWLDYISRNLLRSGRLAALVDEGLTGVTSNPTIFQKAIAAGGEYDEQIAALAARGKNAYEVYEGLALRDIADAADVLRPVFNEKHGRDGFVSLEVNPALAHDTAGTIAEARRLFAAVGRPNVMIKVPATPAGIPAIAALIGESINVNVTLIFGLDMYRQVMQAYLDGLRAMSQRGRPLAAVASVASFFVSRVDTAVDALLQARIDAGEDGLEPLLGKAAVMNAKLAYDEFRKVFSGPAFAELGAAGARVQRPLWASTSTKNPAYPDLIYVEPLIGPNTVNTVPPGTLDVIRDRAVVAQSVEQDVAQARAYVDHLRQAGVDFDAVTTQLMHDGVRLFAESFDKLLTGVEAKRGELTAAAAGG